MCVHPSIPPIFLFSLSPFSFLLPSRLSSIRFYFSPPSLCFSLFLLLFFLFLLPRAARDYTYVFHGVFLFFCLSFFFFRVCAPFGQCPCFCVEKLSCVLRFFCLDEMCTEETESTNRPQPRAEMSILSCFRGSSVIGRYCARRRRRVYPSWAFTAVHQFSFQSVPMCGACGKFRKLSGMDHNVSCFFEVAGGGSGFQPRGIFLAFGLHYRLDRQHAQQ